MTPEETVDAFMAAVNRMDLDAACELVSDECEYDNVPMSKVFGRQAIHDLLAPMIERCSEVEWITVRQAAAGNLVLNERLDRFHWPHGWIEVPVAGVFEVDDGQITLWRDYFDLATYTNQLPG
ncbi:MAG: limonene-1,2-epoxide hydrolase family protein [Microthrixaceae bacterium]